MRKLSERGMARSQYCRCVSFLLIPGKYYFCHQLLLVFVESGCKTFIQLCGISVHLTRVKVAKYLGISVMSYSQQQETPVQTDLGLQLQYTPPISCLPLPSISQPLLGDSWTVQKGCNLETSGLYIYKSEIVEI